MDSSTRSDRGRDISTTGAEENPRRGSKHAQAAVERRDTPSPAVSNEQTVRRVMQVSALLKLAAGLSHSYKCVNHWSLRQCWLRSFSVHRAQDPISDRDVSTRIARTDWWFAMAMALSTGGSAPPRRAVTACAGPGGQAPCEDACDRQHHASTGRRATTGSPTASLVRRSARSPGPRAHRLGLHSN